MIIRFAYLFCILFLPFVTATSAAEQTRAVLHGTPSVRISEGGIDRVIESIQPSMATALTCVIQEIDGKYYWTSRGDKPLVRVTSGAFITYIAADGVGFVRTIEPSLKAAASLMSDTESKFDYVEHLNTGLRSITYYGKTFQ